MRRHLIVFVLALAALGALAGRRLLLPKIAPQAASLTAPVSESYLIILGVGDRADTAWDGAITATGATIRSLRGWRFSGTDVINGTGGWHLMARHAPAGPSQTQGPMQENGILVTTSVPATTVTFDIKTLQGNFTFSSQEVPFGTSKTFLNGRVVVSQTGVPLQLTNSNEDEDFPAMAVRGDDMYLAYTQFVHGDRSQAAGISTSKAITDFAFLGRPAGGDQVLLLHYSRTQRLWTGPFAVTNPGEDVMRGAVSVDRDGRAWVFYSTQRNGNFDLYARAAHADGTMSDEIQLTTDPGTDLYPVATTDSRGRVWVAWQGFRNGNLEVLTAVQTGDTFSPETIVSTSAASDWDPAIAAAPNGDIAISWDTYDKGDYDVYMRRLHMTDQITMDDPIAVAATNKFEVRSSIAYDSQNRLWIAYEVSGPKWGKDWGIYDTSGIALYQNHTIQVRCLVGNDLFATTDDVARVLPGTPAPEVFMPTSRMNYTPQPDADLAANRQPNDEVPQPSGPKNNFPRLAVDPEGTVYLAFREPAGTGLSTSRGTGQSVGSIWTSAMVYFDGNVWHGPGMLAESEGVSDSRPSIIPLGPGHLMMAEAMDHRLTPLPNGTPQVDSANADVYTLELNIARTQQAPKLQRIGTVTPDPQDPAAAAEAASVSMLRSYTTTINGQALQMMRGDFHRHTEISFDGARDGPLIDSYRYFIDAAALDWVGCCDHDNGGAREYSWWLTQKFTDAYLLGTKFVPMFYSERSVAYPEGHRNVVFAQRGVRNLPRLPVTAPNSKPAPAPDTLMLYAYLKYFGGLSAPHTGATDQGTDWRNSDPDVEPFVEIYQGARQSYEMPGSPRSNSAGDSISGFEAAGYISNALGKGIQLGFEASSDHVSTHISFTNLYVTDPTRAGILDAMKKRRMYGSTDNILADFRSDTHFMGEAFTTGAAPVFNVSLTGTAPFQSVVVVKDGTVVYSTSGDSVVSFTWQDQTTVSGKTSYYYVRGVQTDGQIVWVSPMWVTMQ